MQWPTRAARGSRPSTRRFARTSRQRRRKRPRSPGNVGWKTDRLEAEIKNRIADVEAEYNKGEAQKGKDPKSLRDDINKNFLAESATSPSLSDNNATAADAARMKLEDKGLRTGLRGHEVRHR